MFYKLKIILAVIFFLSLNIFCDTTHVLFIGNSYTYVNNLPDIFAQLSASAGKIVYTELSAPGGYTLEGHTTLQETLDKIRSRQWHYVILQEQSQYPTIEYYRINSMYPSAIKLDSLIKINGSNTMFYMTWGRKYGGEQCINGYCSPVFRDYYHLQDSLASAYNNIAQLLNAQLAPVGFAWKRARTLDTAIELWDMDFSHPAIKGSYLTACVFYVKIFGLSPVGLTYYAGIPQNDAIWLQQIAADVLIGIGNNNNSFTTKFKLFNNYPNPFNPVTNISFTIPEKKFTELKIYDIRGSEIYNVIQKTLDAGSYTYSIDLSEYSSGIYFCRLSSGNYIESQKMIFIK